MRHNNNWLTHPDYKALVEFLVKKTKDVKTVMNIRGLIREFKNKSNSTAKIQCLKSRIRRFCSVIHKFPYMDTDTKVKLLFGLSAPVDYKFLEELRKEAEVVIDDFNHITLYKKNGGGLELQGIHKPEDYCQVSNDQFLEFLAEKVEETSGILSIAKLCKHFQAETKNFQNFNHLKHRFRLATEQIYESDGFDENMKIRMMFATGTRVTDQALKELRENAYVVVDRENRIVEYRSQDGSLVLKKKNSTICQVSNDQFLEFLAKKVEETSGIMSIVKLCKDFQAETGNSQNLDHLKQRFRLATEQIFESDQFDENMKIRMMFATSTKIADYALKELRENANVVVDEQNRIVEYRSQDGSLYLNKKDGQKEARINRESERENQRRKRKISDDMTLSAIRNFVKKEKKNEAENSEDSQVEDFLKSIENNDIDLFSILFPNETKGTGGEVAMPSDSPEARNTEMSSSEVNPFEVIQNNDEDQTSLLTVLESFNALIDTLELPILAELQMKINEKITFLKGNEVVQMIPNRDIRFSLDFCLAIINGDAVIIEGEESISLRDFLGHLKFAVVLLKLPYSDSFQQKLNEMIAELRVQDKNVPLSTLQIALETTFDVMKAF